MQNRNLLLLFLIFCFHNSTAQQAAAVDSMKTALASAKTARDKVYWLDNLSRTLMNVNLAEAEAYGKQLISVAEESRERELMIDAYVSNGLRCSYFAGQKDYIPRTIEFYNKALDIARKEKLEAKIGGIQLRMASIYLSIPDKDKALHIVNQAFSLISTLGNDSLLSEANNTYGNVYLARNEKTLALRHYLNALRIAESMEESSAKNELMRNSYILLSRFYSSIDDFDKAIDYATSAFNQLDKISQRNVPYQRAIDLNTIGNLYSNKKNYDIAISYFERSIAMGDSLKFPTLKVPGYLSLLNQYLRLDQPQKALDYMRSSSGRNLVHYLSNFGFSGSIDQAYAVIFTEIGRYDSAQYYFNRAIPYFEKSMGETSVIQFYRQLGVFYKKSGKTEKAIEYFLKVKEMGERLGMLESVQTAAGELDSLYSKSGNYLLASQFGNIYHTFKDSVEKLSREKELTQVEASDEQQRQARIIRENEEKKRRRNNIQYLAITIGIAAVFIALVVLGMFKVSATTIRMIGFFAFIMFFEFIFLLFKKNIYSITKGEPLLDLLFMIGLAALLLPLHHWLEDKAIHYLTSHNRLTSAGRHLKMKLFRRKAGE